MKKKPRFQLTLKVGHPELSAEEIASAFDLPTTKMQTVGEPRITRTGRILGGNWRETNVSFRKSDGPFYFDDFDIEELIRKFLECFDGSYTAHLAETGGGSVFFIGVFTDVNVEFDLSWELMEDLAKAKIRIWYDVYGGPED